MRTLTSACERPFSLPKHRTSPMLAAERPTIRWGMNSLPQRTLSSPACRPSPLLPCLVLIGQNHCAQARSMMICNETCPFTVRELRGIHSSMRVQTFSDGEDSGEITHRPPFCHPPFAGALGKSRLSVGAWWPERSTSTLSSRCERVLAHRSSTGESRPAPPLPALRCRPLFSTPHLSRALSVLVTHFLATSCRPLRLLPARVARSAGVLQYPLQVQQVRIDLRHHQRDRGCRDRLGEHRRQPAGWLSDPTVGRASSVARARAMYPAYPAYPARWLCRVQTRFQPLRWWDPGLLSLPQLRAQAGQALSAGAVGRGEGAAARRSRRGERPGLAAVGARDGWAARRVRRATPASLAVVRSSVGRVPLPVWRPWRSMEVA